jgi:pyrroline-5-carboxylate reductase
MDTAEKIFQCVGNVIRVKEELMDAVVGISGSGPAYFYMVIEALGDAGVKAGLSREQAISLAANTAFGAAAMVLETQKSPAELKDMVTSPAGTTIEAISVLERQGVRAAFIDAVDAAVKRSKELGK